MCGTWLISAISSAFFLGTNFPNFPKNLLTSRSLVLKYLSVSDLSESWAQPSKIFRWKHWIFPMCGTWLISAISWAFFALKLNKFPNFPKLVVSRSLVLKYLSVSDLSAPRGNPQEYLGEENWIFPMCRTWLISAISIGFFDLSI